MSTIKRISIPELMDGRYFFIPAYQRGYRWTSEQVKALLRDLFTYAKGSKHDGQNVVEGDYYCLQPIVARRITNKEEKTKLNIPEIKEAWEIVDGQQRLTTIFILYRYLMKENSIDDNGLASGYEGRAVYHLKYASRPGSENFLGNDLWIQDQSQDANNIDFHHMRAAVMTIDKWINEDAKELCKRYHMQPNKKDIIEVFWKLLNAHKDYTTQFGTVQVLWYELDSQTNVIQEFRETNTNQIRLTDAELIKALFLRNLSEDDDTKQAQLERANQWETIENTLQDNTFWAFLNKRGQDLPNRINLLFKLRYQLEHIACNSNSSSVDECLEECEKDLKKKDFLFNFFNDKFDGLVEQDLANKIKSEWQEILTIFHTLEDWYDDVICYNLIGMLSQFDDSQLACYYNEFDRMSTTDSRENFKVWLKEQLRNKFSNIKYDKESKLKLKYGDKLVFNLLLLLNVNHLNKLAKGNDVETEMGSIYKFPFDVLQKDWDIEHIDSFTSNQLKKGTDKEVWIDVALDDLKALEEKKREEIISLKDQGKLDNAISIIKEEVEEKTMTDEEKNNISNLTLLDAETNRSYGNSLFVTKRRIIIDRMKSGRYVPVTTSYVFMKLFDNSGTNRSKWGEDDMKQYHDYICDELQEYLPEKN